MSLLALALFLAIQINGFSKRLFFSKDILHKTMYPINLIAFAFGTTSILISGFISFIITKRYERRKNGQN
ncbi:hypothetical protein MCSF7_00556 [Mycoplasmopsis columbina SF7]|uniref:Uncharacterized protein n=1 Tax=Mycoplasmopsis columbina SF7 TaxID=1037410 RepID=F9UJR2_9BACT|nr:hypothetical protein MCSF7_00556 [Mycoplasmopsis columbina SF7]